MPEGHLGGRRAQVAAAKLQASNGSLSRVSSMESSRFSCLSLFYVAFALVAVVSFMELAVATI